MNLQTVKIPDHLLNTRSVLWKNSYDDYNFLYCLIRHLWPEKTLEIKNHKKINLQKFMRHFNLKGIQFPMTYGQISKFVNNNVHFPLTIRILFESEKQICVLNTFTNINNKQKKFKNVLNLLMIKSDCVLEKKKVKPSTVEKNFSAQQLSTLKNLCQQHHFFLVKNLQTFLNTRHQTINKLSNAVKCFYCRVCLMPFYSKEKKKNHVTYCQQDKQVVVYPKKGSILQFKNHANSFKTPIIGFADFESLLVEDQQSDSQCDNCSKVLAKCDCEKSSSHVLNKHKACGYSLCFVDSENEVFFQETYSGEDAVEVFLSKIVDYEEIVHKRKQRFQNTTDIKATEEEWDAYQKAAKCRICKGAFDNRSQNWKKVVDHDHVSGGKIGAAHSLCNVNRSGLYHTPLYFHNASG